MLTDSMTLDRLKADDIAVARECMLRLLANDIAIGSWSDKTEVRQTGCSVHIKYSKKATVTLGMGDGGTSNEFVVLMLKSPDVLWSLLVKLFDVSDEDLEALKAEVAGNA